MLIYCKHLNHQIYDYIRSSINNVYRIDTMHNEDIIMNAVPIKYKDNYWIVSNLANLEISSLDLTKEKYEIKYMVNEDINGSIFISKVYSLHELCFNSDIEGFDCLYDEHLNIMFIKFQDERIEYFDINDYKFENFEEFEKHNIIFSWINNLLQKKTVCSSQNKILFENKFLNLPSIPYAVSDSAMIPELTDSSILNFPCTGASVLNETGKLLGIVAYAGKKQIVTIPLDLIKRSLSYADNTTN